MRPRPSTLSDAQWNAWLMSHTRTLVTVVCSVYARLGFPLHRPSSTSVAAIVSDCVVFLVRRRGQSSMDECLSVCSVILMHSSSCYTLCSAACCLFTRTMSQLFTCNITFNILHTTSTEMLYKARSTGDVTDLNKTCIRRMCISVYKSVLMQMLLLLEIKM